MGYLTIKTNATAELVEKRSRFLARVSPVDSEESAIRYLNEIRQDHTASHHVFAYRLRVGNLSRYSDDGEPGGTAGLPVLDVLDRPGITDAIIVVTRWFGGTLLGTGGLVRAYSSAAKLAVEAAGVVEMELAGRYRLSVPYSDYDRVLRCARDCGIIVDHPNYSEVVRIELIGTEEPIQLFSETIKEMSKGKNFPELIEKKYLPIKEKKVF